MPCRLVSRVAVADAATEEDPVAPEQELASTESSPDPLGQVVQEEAPAADSLDALRERIVHYIIHVAHDLILSTVFALIAAPPTNQKCRPSSCHLRCHECPFTWTQAHGQRRSTESGPAPKYCDRIMPHESSSAANLLTSTGLTARGPVVWGSPVTSDTPGVYVVESANASDGAPIDPAAVGAWIKRVPTLLLDGQRPTAAELTSRLASFWIPGEAVVYIGLAGTSVAKRVRQFYRTPLGDPRPHAGGHWLKTLATLLSLRVWWAETDDPAADEDALLVAFGDRVSAKPGQNLVAPVLPFANRQTATGIRKVHGISGSTLDRSPRPPGLLPARSVSKTLASGTPAARSAATRSSLAEINRTIQAIACGHSDREVTAVEAAQELDRLGLLRDSPTRRGKPLRDLLRAGSIDFSRQDDGRWWFIDCGRPDGQR